LVLGAISEAGNAPGVGAMQAATKLITVLPTQPSFIGYRFVIGRTFGLFQESA
jgi:hypothetical protein